MFFKYKFILFLISLKLKFRKNIIYISTKTWYYFLEINCIEFSQLSIKRKIRAHCMAQEW